MKVYGQTPGGRRSRKPLTDHPMTNLAGSGITSLDTSKHHLSTSGTLMAARDGKYLHPAPPMATCIFGTPEMTIELSWAEVEHLYHFMANRKENKLREEFNQQYNLSPF